MTPDPIDAPGPARRVPNTSMTEADWLEVMEAFLAGWSDAKCARRWNLSPSTVAAQRFKRGVMRENRPRPEAAMVLAGEAEALAPSASDAPALLIPEGDDSVEIARAILEHGRALLRAGRVTQAVAVTRLARSYLLAVRDLAPASAEAAAEAESRAPPPELRWAQRSPNGDWRTWLFLGGRGAGKTLAGAAWLAEQAHDCGRLALVGPTYADVREVMIEGPSGLRGAAVGFGPGRPRYEASRRRLVWENGAVAHVFTAEEPDGLRGPQSPPPGPTRSAPGRVRPRPWPFCAWAFAWDRSPD